MSKPRGAQKGNKNAVKTKEWADAIRRALARYSDDEVKRGQAINAIAERTVRDAIAGDKDARKEIAERLDGKSAQSIDFGDNVSGFAFIVKNA